MLLGQALPRRFEVDAVALGDRLDQLLVVGGAVRGPGRERALADGQRRIGDDQVGVDLHLRAEAGAPVARTVRRVEREDPRLELGDRGAVLRACELLGEGEHAVLVDQLDVDQPVGQRHRGLDRVGQALADVLAHHEPVDDERDVVLVLLVEVEVLVQPADLAVDLHARVALRPQLLEELPVLALSAAHQRRHDHEARPLGKLHDLVDDLLRRLPGDRTAADVAVGMADARPEQAQVVVDLGDGADRRPRVARGRLLVDRDGRRQALDRVDVGFVHLPEELPGVGGQRLHVPALALGVDRVERERALTRPGQPGYDDQGVPRKRDVDVLEVVLACSGDHELGVPRHPPHDSEANRRSGQAQPALCGRELLEA